MWASGVNRSLLGIQDTKKVLQDKRVFAKHKGVYPSNGMNSWIFSVAELKRI